MIQNKLPFLLSSLFLLLSADQDSTKTVGALDGLRDGDRVCLTVGEADLRDCVGTVVVC